MSGNKPGARARHVAPPDLPALRLDIRRVLDTAAFQAVRAEFRFDQDTPLVVTTAFRIDNGPCVTWRVGRDLLHQGLCSMSGLGDIQMWPSHLDGQQTAWLRLASKGVAALFEVPVPPLAEWLDLTYRLVPAGTEASRLGWDDFIADLLDDPEVPSG